MHRKPILPEVPENMHLLTPAAKKLLYQQYAGPLTDADWDSFHAYSDALPKHLRDALPSLESLTAAA